MPKYFIRCNGKTYGPASVPKITDRIQSGVFSLYSYVSLDQKDWFSISDVEDFASLLDNTPPQQVLFAPPRGENASVSSENAELDMSDSVHNKDLKKSKALMGGNTSKKKKMALITGSILNPLIVVAILWVVFVFRSNSFVKVSEKYGSAVGLVILSLKNAHGVILGEYPIGTAFAVDHNTFATNAHVASALNTNVVALIYTRDKFNELVKQGLIGQNQEDIFSQQVTADIENKRIVPSFLIRLNHCDGKTLSIQAASMHPKYAHDVAGEYDIAILKTTETVNTFFPIAKQSKLYSLKPGDEIAYLGFPMEGLAASGGIDLQNPEASLKSGIINKLTNIHDVNSPSPQDNIRITHDIPTVGGASGSPIFVKNGEIVAILWGGNMELNERGERMPSAALHNFATRIDIIEDVLKQKPIEISEFIK